MRHSKFGVIFGAVLGASALILSGCSGDTGGGESVDSPGVTADTITIGTISDQTGPTTGIQVPWLHGVQAAIGAANDAGGVNGREIELLSEDDKYDAAVGQPAFKKLVSQTPVAAILGVNTGNVQAAVAPLVEAAGVPVVSGLTSIKDAIDPVDPYFFGLAPTYADQVTAILGYAAEVTGDDDFTVAVIHNGGATGVEVRDIVQADATGGIEYLGEVVLEPTATSADAQLQSIVALDPDVIVFHGSSAGINLFNRTQEKFGTEYPLIGISPSGGPSAFNGVTPEYGSLFSYVQWATPVPIEADGTDAMVAAAEAAGYEDEVNNPDFVEGYAAGLVIVEALKNAGDNPNRDSIRDALEALGDFSTGGVTPNVSFSADDHVGVQDLRPLTWNYDDSVFEAVGEYGDFSG